MSAERQKIQFTSGEEQRIGCVVSSLLEQGEDAIDRLRDTRYGYKLLEFAVLLKTRSIEYSRAAGGRTVELANEAIERAQKELEARGEDRINKLRESIEEKSNTTGQ